MQPYDNLSQIYKGIASEAYRRAVSESGEPAKYTHKIELTALTDQFRKPGNPVNRTGQRLGNGLEWQGLFRLHRLLRA
jgi:hypothetical protein